MNRNNSCFTLIEVLLALFITAILITILSVVFNTGLRSYRQGKDLLEITRKAQLILGQMTKELSGVMVQDGYIPFEGENDSIYFMAPVENSSKLDLCEIGYTIDKNENTFKRHFLTYGSNGFEYPGLVDYENQSLQTFCKGVIAFNLRYCTGNNWSDEWNDIYTLPQLVEVAVKIQGEYPKDKPKQNRTFTTWIYLPYSTNNP